MGIDAGKPKLLNSGLGMEPSISVKDPGDMIASDEPFILSVKLLG